MLVIASQREPQERRTMGIKGLSLLFQAAPKYSSSSVKFQGLAERTGIMKMDMEEADMTLWTEAEFEEKCTYIVNDHPWDSGADGGTSVQAEASLPRNLLFKYATSNSKEVSLCLIEDWLALGLIPLLSLSIVGIYMHWQIIDRSSRCCHCFSFKPIPVGFLLPSAVLY